MKNEQTHGGNVIEFSSKSPLEELETLFNSSYKKLVGLACLLILPREVAEDIVQEVFISTTIKVREGSEIKNLSAYIKSAIALKAKEYHRKNFLRSAKISEIQSLASTNSDIADQISENERIIELINALPQAQKQCVVLKYYEQLENSEISTFLNISESTLRTHLARASQTIKTALERIEG